MSSVTTTIRTFIALELPGEVKAALGEISHILAAELGEAARVIRWTRPESIHLTLQFLGDMPVGMQQLVIEAVGRGCRGFEPINLSLAPLGVFPHLKRPRVVWVGLTGDEGGMNALLSLQASVSAELAKLGFAHDKSFHPHLTLGRVREQADLPDLGALTSVVARQAVQPSPLSFKTLGVSLMKSDHLPGGSKYTRLAAIKLTHAT